MSTLTLFKDNTVIAELQNVKSSVTDDYVLDATVTITLKDSAGNNVTGETWPAPLSFVSGSKGLYRGVLSDAMQVTVGEIYDAVVVAIDGQGSKGSWNIPARCKVRR